MPPCGRPVGSHRPAVRAGRTENGDFSRVTLSFREFCADGQVTSLYESCRLVWGHADLNAYGDSKFWSATHGIMRKSPVFPVSGEGGADTEKRKPDVPNFGL